MYTVVVSGDTCLGSLWPGGTGLDAQGDAGSFSPETVLTMEPRILFAAWRWPLALVLALASMGLAVLAAGVAFDVFMAIPKRALPWFTCGMGGFAALSVMLARRRRGARGKEAERPTTARRTF